MKFLVLLLSVIPAYALRDITCPDMSTCHNNETCCSTAEGSYACCPFPDAVCCEDVIYSPCKLGILCLPSLYLGIVPGTSRLQVSETYNVPKPPTLSNGVLKSMPYPGARDSCPDKNTCCPTGCCPEPNAVCCSDGKHCCSAGSYCNIKRQKCVHKRAKAGANKKKMIRINARHTLKLKALYPAFSVSAEHVTCPGGENFCTDNNTCCLSNAGGWKCCSFPQASCCSDGKHCCPKGTTCNSERQSCVPGSS